MEWSLRCLAYIEVGIIGRYIFLCICLEATGWICPEVWGSYSLGKNIYMMEDALDGYYIVQGRKVRTRVCEHGDYIVPLMSEMYDSLGREAEYVVDAKYNRESIIVRTDNYQTHCRKYYIISKDFTDERIQVDSIINNYLWEFTDSNEFIARCEKDGIALRF